MCCLCSVILGAIQGHRFQIGIAYEIPAEIVFALEMLVGERVVVKGIEIFGDFWH